MKKFDFKKLALMGITGGVMCATQVNAVTAEQPKAETASKPTAAKMDEAQFTSKLNAESKAMYMKMDAEGKALALKLANDGSYTDVNQAVKAANDRMEAKHKMKH